MSSLKKRVPNHSVDEFVSGLFHRSNAFLEAVEMKRLTPKEAKRKMADLIAKLQANASPPVAKNLQKAVMFIRAQSRTPKGQRRILRVVNSQIKGGKKLFGIKKKHK